MPSEAPATVVAYQRLRLREIRGLYEELYPSLDHYLGVEQRVSDEIDVVEDEFGAVRETLISLGADVGEQGDPNAPVHPASPLPPGSPATEAPLPIDFEDLVTEAGRYLTENGIDPNRDPLLQVLGSAEVSEIRRRYKKSFGDVEWDESDYLTILLAGFVATLLDVFLVRIPMDMTFLGSMQPGSPT